MLSLQYQMDGTEKMTPSDITRQQLIQAQQLLYIASRNVPFYKETLLKIDTPLTTEIWQKIPVLERDQLFDAHSGIINSKPLRGHDEMGSITTSGSTGKPITAYSTQVTRLFWDAYTLRDHLWHKRDLSQKLVAIRPEIGEPGKPLSSDNWGSGTAQVYQTGPAAALNIRTDVSEQLAWLVKQKPGYLLSTPSNLNELAKLALAKQISLPSLKQLRTMGELLTDATRDNCRAAWGVEIADVYSAQEVGYIAMQCPEHGSYHVQSDSLLVEILDENNQPCAVGQPGRVVVTTLLNFGAPLIRYALGDYAQFGEPCPCGRGLPVLEKVLGRQRNMMRNPDGRVHWPSFPSDYWSLGKIRQLQLVQKEPDLLLIRLVAEPLTDDEMISLQTLFQQRFEYPYRFEFEYLDTIPRSKSGKYEDFICQV